MNSGIIPNFIRSSGSTSASSSPTERSSRRSIFERLATVEDDHVDRWRTLFQANGGSLVMLAKGNRGPAVTQACRKHGGFYLGSIGGPAAILAKDNIRKVELLEYPELGMEAVWRIEVEDFPAFILVDDKGNDFFVNGCGACLPTKA